MSIIQDLYLIFDKEYARHRERRCSKNLLVLELRHNLAFLRAGLAEQLPGTTIVAGLEQAQYRQATEKGTALNAIQKRRLARRTYGGIREFEKYHDWSTEQLIHKAYERIAVLKKLDLDAGSVNVRARLQYLFKFLMLLIAHIDGETLHLSSSASRQ
ncbi:hypothetical protein [Sedimenticola thiotaurini]|uniref:Uncharacterized protein n=1 Tax=Sedimenticola thiotaurini TaxID=1543721 RepID=A0A0F7JZE2_9GAMM|nr:hypothetical protein [Sedimenticola thiotaurini]AKH20699.1 hypothetical protein AAY24_10395 [Sedimenticola thiotaurini]